ncbi:DinB family protein [Flammeovirga pectinis]|uniref:DinB family protein n=1 Tax=Flammeovirga pectinis TaxID=2494373 RepID=A0A3Q9FRH8_9BACT|nr:DinB family protein [Flammeovirga pectinis]AZQ65422.1 DinB family protein [Flammeovirga pectinis]
MNKKELPFMPEYFDRYINLTEDNNVVDVLSESITKINSDFVEQLEKLGTQVYAANKWTALDLLQHLIDTERILAYRALRFAREDKTPIPGFEENDYAVNSMANHRELSDLINEFQAVRLGTIALFKSFSDEMLLQVGTASGQEISVLALGFTIVGHQIHHMNILDERYFPMLNS